jgi:hypothetical protein
MNAHWQIDWIVMYSYTPTTPAVPLPVATAAPIIGGSGTSTLAPALNGLCVTPYRDNVTWGNIVEQDTCANLAAQKYTFLVQGNYYLLQAVGTSYCLDYSNDATAGAQVLVKTCAKRNSQLLSVIPFGDGTYQLRSADGRGCLGVISGGSGAGAEIVSTLCDGSPSQRIKATGFVPPPPIIGGHGTSQLIPSMNGLCIDAYNSNPVWGNIVNQVACSTAASQKFTFLVVGNYYLLESGTSGMCIDYGSDAGANAQTTVKSCANRVSQKLSVYSNTDGTYTIMSADGKGCLGIKNGTSGSGAAIVSAPCDGSAYQKIKAAGFSR